MLPCYLDRSILMSESCCLLCVILARAIFQHVELFEDHLDSQNLALVFESFKGTRRRTFKQVRKRHGAECCSYINT